MHVCVHIRIAYRRQRRFLHKYGVRASISMYNSPLETIFRAEELEIEGERESRRKCVCGGGGGGGEQRKKSRGGGGQNRGKQLEGAEGR